MDETVVTINQVFETFKKAGIFSKHEQNSNANENDGNNSVNALEHVVAHIFWLGDVKLP